jgi:phytoene dehydrogenase-like protein
MTLNLKSENRIDFILNRFCVDKKQEVLMAKYDVIIIGGGPCGMCTAAILGKNGKRVLLLEKNDQMGGRALGVSHEGHELNFAWHQSEDSGSGLTKVFEYVGKELRHGPISEGVPLYIDGKWQPIQEILAKDRSDFKKFIKMLTEEMTWDDIERMDDKPIRPWARKHFAGDGIVTWMEMMAVYDGVSFHWWDHSLSEQLWLRKLHLTERKMAAYCFSPMDGWEYIWRSLAEAVTEYGGEIRTNTPVVDIVIENGRVLGVEVQTHPPIMPTDYPETEIIEAPCVVSTLTCWDVLKIVDESLLPKWYVDQIKFMAQDELRCIWLGLYAALPEPMSVFSAREAPGWFHGPITGLMGVCSDLTAFQPDLAPKGEHLITAMVVVEHDQIKNRRLTNKIFADFEKELEVLFPVYKKRLWSERHVVYDPTYSVVWKPGVVGRYRPDVEAPNVEGLYFGGDTFRGRGVGVDRAGRIAMTVSERVLGKAIPEFKGSPHYK